MAEYAITTCVDNAGERPLPRDAAVFIRRIQPALGTVYTIICDAHGRARPWQATRGVESAIRTGPVNVSADSVYLATWIPASDLPRQGNVAQELGRLGRDARYEFQPARQDQHLRRVRAARWQGSAPALTPGDAALVGVLNEMGLSSLAVQGLMTEPQVRRELARRMFEELEEVKMRELSGGFVLGANDDAGQLRERLLTNPRYSGGNAQRRGDMIAEWQRRLQTAR